MKIKELWKNNILYKQGKIELVPTDWVWNYYGKDVSSKTNLMDGTLVHLDDLWENICKEGLYDPFVIRVGIKNKKFRLESGNHRIQAFHKNHIKMIPVTVQIKEECGPHVIDIMTDAQHNFDFNSDIIITDHINEYVKPSSVFKNLKDKVL